MLRALLFCLLAGTLGCNETGLSSSVLLDEVDEPGGDGELPDEEPVDDEGEPEGEGEAPGDPIADPPIGDDPSDEDPSDEDPADEDPEDEPVDEDPAEEEPEDGPVDEGPVDDGLEDEEPADDEPAEEDPEDEEPVDDEPGEEDLEEEDPAQEPPPEEEPPPADDCADTSDLVYVIDRDEEALYLFDPVAVSFGLVGDLDCGLWAGTPASMSVSRDGFAYVRYSDNTVYAVDLQTMDCTETSYGSSFGSFGMGFATEDAATWQDDLYVANANLLARLDTATWSLTTLGGLPSQSELTGNAAGELWAMLPLETPAELVQLDKGNGQVLDSYGLWGFPDPFDIDTFAFATWGGEFWVFVRSYGMGNSTDVYRVTATGVLELVWPDSGMDVVGAGVSTCAPAQ